MPACRYSRIVPQSLVPFVGTSSRQPSRRTVVAAPSRERSFHDRDENPRCTLVMNESKDPSARAMPETSRANTTPRKRPLYFSSLPPLAGARLADVVKLRCPARWSRAASLRSIGENPLPLCVGQSRRRGHGFSGAAERGTAMARMEIQANSRNVGFWADSSRACLRIEFAGRRSAEPNRRSGDVQASVDSWCQLPAQTGGFPRQLARGG